MLSHTPSTPYHTPGIGPLKVPRKVEKGAKKIQVPAEKKLCEKMKNAQNCLKHREK